MSRFLFVSVVALSIVAPVVHASRQPLQPTGADRLTADTFRGLALRPLGPSLVTGRIADIAIDPRNPSVWYVAAASGGVWKTVNRGNTWTPIFDDYGAYSMGCITIDPKDSNVIWLGTGENQSQRSVGFGDGVYKSVDAGRTWSNVGLGRSEHIAKILVDPRDSNVVWVAAQGPLWAPGGDRGLYKTPDGGKTWTPALQASENTGIADIAFDPRNPDVLYAASYQRRRHQGLLVGGGPESTIYKTTDGGRNWSKIDTGLPAVDRGRIALAVSPQRPDTVYALVAAAGKESGFFRSLDRGATWQRMSDYIVVDPQYYGEIYPDPHKAGRVYAVDVRINVTEDEGKTFKPTEWNIHVDHHAIGFDPRDPLHLWVGNDGGLYETFDGGKAWRHFTNLPITQLYNIALDDARPFYNVCGGSQDNGSICGPSRTLDRVGIRTSDWIVVGGGDGMQPRVEPGDPALVYSQSQNGALQRLDLRTSVSQGIRPRAGEKEPPLRWNWNAPLIISPHSATRLYFAANRLFRSDDRGTTWTPVSPDLTRQIDRDTLPVMGRVWGPDAVWKNVFTTDMSIITALDESPLLEGLLYVGTDEGLVQVSEDGGRTWRRTESWPGAPEMPYVSDVHASRRDANVVYAALHHFQRGDFRPYLFKSTDRGRTWTGIAGDLPDRQFVWSLVEDPVNSSLLFAGTELGVFFTIDGGRRWIQLSGGMPTVAVRDLEIQRRETDLVCGTFGRGFYVLDDYTPLRTVTAETLARDGAVLPMRSASLYNERAYTRAAWGNEAIPNPPYGATFTYWVRDALPAGDTATKLVLIVKGAEGVPIRALELPGSAGVHRATWDLRGEPRVEKTGDGQSRQVPGALVAPGRFTVTLAKKAGEALTPLGEQTFEVVALR